MLMSFVDVTTTGSEMFNFRQLYYKTEGFTADVLVSTLQCLEQLFPVKEKQQTD